VLHEHGAQFDGGGTQPVLIGDHALSFVLDDRVPRDGPPWGTMLAEAMARAQAAIDALWARPPHAPHILHGDFNLNNILVWRGRLTPLDFQDLLWGFEIQDIAITMSQLEYFADATALAAALRAGYERLRPWPAEDAELLTTLIAARHLSVLNLGFNLRRPGFDAFVSHHTEWLREWMGQRVRS
jgi:Ser/Thr protein kinase RdoA (MazF antagonist)